MGTYTMSKEDVDQLADDIFDLLYNFEGDFYFRHLLRACKKAYKRFVKMRREAKLRS